MLAGDARHFSTGIRQHFGAFSQVDPSVGRGADAAFDCRNPSADPEGAREQPHRLVYMTHEVAEGRDAFLRRRPLEWSPFRWCY